MFLNEGIKIYFRMVYALLKTFKEEILQYNDATTLKTYIRKMSINMKKSKVEKITVKRIVCLCQNCLKAQQSVSLCMISIARSAYTPLKMEAFIRH